MNQDKITFRQRAQLYLNQGNGLFDEVTPADGPLTQEMVARGGAYADYDQDGDLDILTCGATTRQAGTSCGCVWRGERATAMRWERAWWPWWGI